MPPAPIDRDGGTGRYLCAVCMTAPTPVMNGAAEQRGRLEGHVIADLHDRALVQEHALGLIS